MPPRTRKIRRKVTVTKSPEDKLRQELSRLRKELERYEGFDEVMDLARMPGAKNHRHLLIEQLMFRVNCEVHTLQINDPDNRAFRVHMSYDDRQADPRWGYLYPKHHATFISPSLAQAVTICYVDLCHQLGRIIHANKGTKSTPRPNGAGRVQGRKKLRRKVRSPTGSTA